MPTITTSGGVRLAYEVHGDGPLVVLVHGLADNRRAWDPLVPPLARDHTVIALDLRGHGESGDGQQYDVGSMAGDVDELLEELAAAGDTGRPAPLVVGHSLGGVVATAFAATYPCRGVVNVDQPLALAGFQEVVCGLGPALRGTTGEFTGAMVGVFDAMVGPLPASERLRIEEQRRLDQDVVLGVWSLLLDTSREEVDAFVVSILQHVAVPYLSLHGIDVGDEYGPWLRSLMPGAIVEVWSGSGHYPHLVHPDTFLARLAAFEAALPPTAA